MEDERGNRLYGDTYPQLLSNLVEQDAQITAALYQLVCTPHLTQELLEYNQHILSLQKTLSVTAAEQNQYLDGETNLNALNQRLLTLQGTRADIRNELSTCGAIAAYELKEGSS